MNDGGAATIAPEAIARVCRKCAVNFKPTRDQIKYYRHICLVCQSRAATKWARDNPKRKLLGNKAYFQTAKGKAARQRQSRFRIKMHSEKRRANYRVQTAIRNGTLVRQPCAVCETQPAEAHHENYLLPLDVVWLCKQHHDERHRTMIAEWEKRNSEDTDAGAETKT